MMLKRKTKIRKKYNWVKFHKYEAIYIIALILFTIFTDYYGFAFLGLLLYLITKIK